MGQQIYQIRVEGRISQRWAHWFDDMTITAHEETHDQITTWLTGPVADQAALMGLLHKLYTLGLPLLSVDRKEAGDIGTIAPDKRQIDARRIEEENGGINDEE